MSSAMTSSSPEGAGIRTPPLAASLAAPDASSAAWRRGLAMAAPPAPARGDAG